MIKVKDIMEIASSYEDGFNLREKVSEELKSGIPIMVDFDGIYVFTTIFFNACSGHFVLEHSEEWYNKNIKIINLTSDGIETHKQSVENAKKMRKDVEFYYNNNAEKLHSLVDLILNKLGFVGFVDPEDFYSLANEVFVKAMKRYDGSKPFVGFLYSCLVNKFKTEMTRRNRKKRLSDKMSVSIYTPVGEDEGTSISDILPDNYDLEGVVINKNCSLLQKLIDDYLSRLSTKQRKVFNYLLCGYNIDEISEAMGCSSKDVSQIRATLGYDQYTRNIKRYMEVYRS